MNQLERLDFLIMALLEEYSNSQDIQLPIELSEKQHLLRSLMNVRYPYPIDNNILKVQNEYLQTELKSRGVVKFEDLLCVKKHIYLYQGDITRLQVDAIVNAANTKMLGCFIPCHGCIDNAIHSYAGIQLRLACQSLMEIKGRDAQIGEAILTPAFQLPCQYIIHVVGPIVHEQVTQNDCEMLRKCYRACLETAVQNHCQHIALCCLSTGEFHFPQQLAAEIAVKEVEAFLKDHSIEIVFNVFKDQDLQIYQQLLEGK